MVKICARPSGTEPKIKFYFSVNTTLDSVENMPTKSKLNWTKNKKYNRRNESNIMDENFKKYFFVRPYKFHVI
jgi:phosphomannomutase